MIATLTGLAVSVGAIALIVAVNYALIQGTVNLGVWMHSKTKKGQASLAQMEARNERTNKVVAHINETYDNIQKGNN